MNLNQPTHDPELQPGIISERESGDFDEYWKYIKIVIGVVLLAIGVYMGMWLFLKITTYINHPDKLKEFQFSGREEQLFEIKTDDGDHVQVPVGSGMNFLIYIIFLSIVAGLCSTFIKAGVNLIHSSLPKLERKIDKLHNKLNRLKK